MNELEDKQKKFDYNNKHCIALFRPVARIHFGGCKTPKKWMFLTQKVDFLNLTPLHPPTKTQFLDYFVAKSGPFGRFGGVALPGYGPGFISMQPMSKLLQVFRKTLHYSVLPFL